MGNKSYSKGISWFDDCRIPFVDEKVDLEKVLKQKPKDNNFGGFDNKHFDKLWYKETGRFPANLLVCDDMLNDGNKPNKGHRAKSKVSGYGEFGGGKSEYHGIGEYMNVDSTSRYYDIDKWFDKIIHE